ncbi:GLOBIN domain-containing protein [Caerostris darwini]|uniref:GLOBIN domain-containing protein n=1 Tax=Caerostris darwini TaxID=1538125 RepID=A0AAV4N3H4_9ARAC|nr:GLOBIN domain-containing protein [Caerostris darwini]
MRFGVDCDNVYGMSAFDGLSATIVILGDNDLLSFHLQMIAGIHLSVVISYSKNAQNKEGRSRTPENNSSLFETHPDVQDVFMPFKGLTKDGLRHSTELRAHGLRVMSFVQKVVARFEEPDKSEALLQELGKNHVMYGAKMDYVDVSTSYSI